MTTAPAEPGAGAEAARDALAERLIGATIATLELMSMYIGDQLGYYRALRGAAPMTAGELATATGTNERYVREWLEQQAVAGLLAVDDASAAPGARRFSLPPGHDEVLADPESLYHVPPFGRVALSGAGVRQRLLDAYRNGGGVSWDDYGPDASQGQAGANRPAFLHLLGSEWMPGLPDVHERLQASPPARVADFGCGEGWSSIAYARAYPLVEVDGYDLDGPAVKRARQHAESAGVADRVRFHLADASDPALAGQYDLVTVFEALHDMARPVEALATMRRLAGDRGTVLVVDERVAERFTAPGDDVERMMYGWSVSVCLTNSLAEQPSAATGTVMRPDTLRQYATQAGFRGVEVLPIENDFFRFYRLEG